MLKYLVVLVIIIDIYTLIDCAMTPQEKVRRFPKWAWLLIIILTGIKMGMVTDHYSHRNNWWYCMVCRR